MSDQSPSAGHGARDEHREVLHRSAATLLVKIMSAGVAFAFSLVLARVLGASGAGRFYVAQNIAALTSVLARLGLDQSVVRGLGAATALGDTGAVRGTLRHALLLTGLASAALTGVVMLAAAPLADFVFDDPDSAPVIRAMAAAIAPISLFTVQASALRGVHRPVSSMVVLQLLTPLSAAALVWLALPTAGVVGAAWAWCIGACIAFLCGAWSFFRATPTSPPGARGGDLAGLLRGARPLLVIAFVRQLDTVLPGLVLAAFAPSHDVGLYNAAARTAILTSFVLVGVNAVVGARFAASFQLGDHARVERLARYTTKLMTLAALPILAVFVLFPRPVMGLFGPEFLAAAPLLAIMAVGQYVNVATGSVQILLIMSGNERIARTNMTTALLVCVLCCLTLIPAFGAVGAACAAAATVAVQNLAGAWWVRQKLNISTNPFLGRGSTR